MSHATPMFLLSSWQRHRDRNPGDPATSDFFHPVISCDYWCVTLYTTLLYFSFRWGIYTCTSQLFLTCLLYPYKDDPIIRFKVAWPPWPRISCHRCWCFGKEWKQRYYYIDLPIMKSSTFYIYIGCIHAIFKSNFRYLHCKNPQEIIFFPSTC